MGLLPHVPFIELHVPRVESEQEFLRLTVLCAVRKYRAMHSHSVNPPGGRDPEACSLDDHACRGIPIPS
jgi:hypothetical protein